MKTVWSIIGLVVAALLFLGYAHMLAFRPSLFLVLLLLLSLLISTSLWIYRKKL